MPDRSAHDVLSDRLLLVWVSPRVAGPSRRRRRRSSPRRRVLVLRAARLSDASPTHDARVSPSEQRATRARDGVARARAARDPRATLSGLPERADRERGQRRLRGNDGQVGASVRGMWERVLVRAKAAPSEHPPSGGLVDQGRALPLTRCRSAASSRPATPHSPHTGRLLDRCFLPRNLYPTSSPWGSGRAFSAESLGKGLGTIPA